MSRIISTLAALATGAAFVSAQLSSGCTTALTQIAADPNAAACLSPASLIPLFAGSGNTSIVDPINNWLTNICAAAPCSNATISSVITTIFDGCSTELSGIGVGSTATAISAVEQVYPTARQVLCLKDSNTNCITQTLTNAQSVLGTISIDKIVSLLVNPLPTGLPANVTCTDCTKASYNIIHQDLPDLATSDAGALQAQCGSSFTDGTNPSGISESAPSPSHGSALGAVSMMSTGALAGTVVSVVAMISTGFAFLA